MIFDDINDKLKQLDIEDYIWVIYLGIIFLSWYSNSLERKYYLFNDLISKDKYRYIMIVIFFILFIVYIYFLKDAYDSFKSLKPSDSYNKRFNTILALIAAFLIAISGAIYLYISFVNDDLGVELAFN